MSRGTAATAAAATPPSLPDGGPPRDAPPPADSKGTKRVTYAPVKSVSADGPHPAGRVRVVVKRTPPPPPVRYQSLPHRHGDGASPPSGLRSAPPTPAEVCPWELLQEETLRQKQNGGEPPPSAPPGDAAPRDGRVAVTEGRPRSEPRGAGVNGGSGRPCPPRCPAP